MSASKIGDRLVQQFKFHRWEVNGLDDFLKDEEENVGKTQELKRDKVMASDILDLMEQKYTRLREKLLQIMGRLFSGEMTWEIMADSERYDLIDEVLTVTLTHSTSCK